MTYIASSYTSTKEHLTSTSLKQSHNCTVLFLMNYREKEREKATATSVGEEEQQERGVQQQVQRRLRERERAAAAAEVRKRSSSREFREGFSRGAACSWEMEKEQQR
uniref:Uncharacterized protein n=1 Tax=Triticum urartu TaxID=4572 RepID=A0A8R7U7E3_TRIUA